MSKFGGAFFKKLSLNGKPDWAMTVKIEDNQKKVQFIRIPPAKTT
jgi:hypothetical protein